MAVFYFLVFFATSIGVIALHRHQDLALTAYKVLTVVSLCPYLIHVWWAWDEVSGFGYISPDGPLIGVYPGLVAFALFSISLVVGLIIFAVLQAHRYPLVIALTPIAAGFFYRIVALSLLSWQVPGGFVFLDNVPLVWLFGSSVFSAVFMGIVGWVALVLPERSNRSR